MKIEKLNNRKALIYWEMTTENVESIGVIFCISYRMFYIRHNIQGGITTYIPPAIF